MYTIQTTTPPTSEPVSAEELHAHLNLNVALSAVEDLLEVYITAARELFEKQTDGRIVLPTTFRQTMASLPEWWDDDGHVKLYRAQVLSVTTFTYYDTEDASQTLTGWALDASGTPALVSMPVGGWPGLSSNRSRRIAIDFVAGWPNKLAVPQAVRLAIMNLAGHFYNVRESHSEIDYKEVPQGFARVVNLYRTGLGGI